MGLNAPPTVKCSVTSLASSFRVQLTNVKNAGYAAVQQKRAQQLCAQVPAAASEDLIHGIIR